METKWQNFPYYGEGKCTFDDGQIVIAKEVDGHDTDELEGGVDPDGYFKLIINGHYVYDKMQFFTGHAKMTFDLSAIGYDGKTLLECNPQEQTDYDRDNVTSNPVCYDESKRLLPGRKYLTHYEQLEFEADQRLAVLERNLSQFCRSLPVRRYSDETSALVSPNPGLLFDGSGEDGDEQDIDINNDGKTDRILFYKQGFWPPYDDAGYLIAFTRDVSKADDFLADHAAFAKVIADAENQNDPQAEALQKGSRTLKQNWDAYLINLGDDNDVLTWKGKQYIYSENLYGELPSVNISEMLPNNTIKTICAFP